MLHTNILSLPVRFKRTKIQLILSFCLLFTCSNMLKAQQEPMYSQYMFNMLHINPAYAGNLADNNVSFLYRKQWTGVVGAPSTGTLSWDSRQMNSNVGYGLQIYNDQLGIEKTTGFQAFYSYRLKFKNSNLSLGLSAGVLNYSAAYSKAKTIDGNDPLFQEDVNGVLPTVGFGALYSSEKFYAGFSIPALLETKKSIDKYQVTRSANNHYFLTSGYIFDVSEAVKLKPSIMAKAVNGAPMAFDINMNMWIQNTVGLGVSYRTGDAVIGLFELQISPQIRLGYSYDYTISNLKSYNVGGSHELMIRYEFKNSKDKSILSPRYY